jgi:RND family efflux transporter MFP subunit
MSSPPRHARIAPRTPLVAALAFAAGASLLALGGCGTPDQDEAQASAPAVPSAAPSPAHSAMPVRTTVAGGGVVVESLSAQGRLEVWRHQLLTVQVAGIIDALPVQPNKAVKAGEVIADLAATPEDQNGEARSRAKLERARRDFARRENLARLAPETISPSELDASRDQLADAQLDQSMYQERASMRHLVAPFDGVLINLAGTVGQRVMPGFMVGEVLDTGRLRLGLDVPETNLRRMRDRQAVEITDVADGTVASGTIAVVPEAIDVPKGCGHVMVDIAKPPADWRPGALVNARLVLGEIASDLVVPRDAVVYRENRPYAWVAEEHEGRMVVRRAWLELGPGDPAHLSVAKGINPGDQVVTEGMPGLSDGVPVMMRNPMAELEKQAGAQARAVPADVRR